MPTRARITKREINILLLNVSQKKITNSKKLEQKNGTKNRKVKKKKRIAVHKMTRRGIINNIGKKINRG
jgi:hypothetical protein